MLASEIPDAYLTALLVFLLGLATGFAGWVAREMYRISELNGRTAERLDDLDKRGEDFDRRIRAMEGLYLPEHERRTT